MIEGDVKWAGLERRFCLLREVAPPDERPAPPIQTFRTLDTLSPFVPFALHVLETFHLEAKDRRRLAEAFWRLRQEPLPGFAPIEDHGFDVHHHHFFYLTPYREEPLSAMPFTACGLQQVCNYPVSGPISPATASERWLAEALEALVARHTLGVHVVPSNVKARTLTPVKAWADQKGWMIVHLFGSTLAQNLFLLTQQLRFIAPNLRPHVNWHDERSLLHFCMQELRRGLHHTPCLMILEDAFFADPYATKLLAYLTKELGLSITETGLRFWFECRESGPISLPYGLKRFERTKDQPSSPLPERQNCAHPEFDGSGLDGRSKTPWKRAREVFQTEPPELNDAEPSGLRKLLDTPPSFKMRGLNRLDIKALAKWRTLTLALSFQFPNPSYVRALEHHAHLAMKMGFVEEAALLFRHLLTLPEPLLGGESRRKVAAELTRLTEKHPSPAPKPHNHDTRPKDLSASYLLLQKGATLETLLAEMGRCHLLPKPSPVAVFEGWMEHFDQNPFSPFVRRVALRVRLKRLQGQTEMVWQAIHRLQHQFRQAVHRRIRQIYETLAQEERARASSPVPPHFKTNILGRAPEIRKVFELIEKISPSRSPVLIHGESGTGKELVAQAIQANSPVADGPFVTVNCAAIAPELIESEFFGHVRGAFTGADTERIGLFERANGGTLFLDEVGDMPLHMQVKFLRVLQEREIKRVGDSQNIPIVVRLICASHRNLKEMVRQRTFREDLYYRLHVILIELPPLRNRKEDIVLLATHFLQQFCRPQEIPLVLHPHVLRAFDLYRWPGNVRELMNLMQKLATLCEGPQIMVHDLPAHFGELLHSFRQVRSHPRAISQKKNFASFLDSFEKAYLSQTLERHYGNVSQAARATGMHRSTYRRLMKRHRIKDKW